MLQADQICYAVLCVFSYVAAGHKKQRRPGPSAHAHVREIASQLPRAAPPQSSSLPHGPPPGTTASSGTCGWGWKGLEVEM